MITLKEMIEDIVLQEVEAKLSTDVAAAQKKHGQVSGISAVEKKINTPQEGAQALLGALEGYGLDHKSKIQALVIAVNTLRKTPGGGVAEAAHNPERKEWKGRSYKKGGEHIRTLKDKQLDPVGKEDSDVNNDGKVDNSDEYLKHRRDAVGSAVKNRDLDEERKKSTTWGVIPPVEELEELMDGEPFDMELKGQDSLAWAYAMMLSDKPGAGSTDTAPQLHASLEALVNASDPDELSDEQYEEVESILDSWFERYGDNSIQEAAWSLASSIMDVLGVEWI